MAQIYPEKEEVLFRLKGIYTMHNKFGNFLCFASFCAHLCKVPITFNCNDENMILGKGNTKF